MPQKTRVQFAGAIDHPVRRGITRRFTCNQWNLIMEWSELGNRDVDGHPGRPSERARTSQWDQAGNWKAVNVYGAKADEILARVDVVHGPMSYKRDRQGNITFLLGASTQIIEKYTYDAFGRPTILSANNAQRSTSAVGNRFMFTGRERSGLGCRDVDGRAGWPSERARTSQWLAEINAYDYRHRLYDPDLGRFLQTDPIGLQTEGVKLSPGQKALFSVGFTAPEAFSTSELNLYRYCGDDPVDRNDPTGLYWDIRGSSAFVNKVLGQLWDAAQKDTNVANAIAEIRDSRTGHIIQQAQDVRNPAPQTANGLKGNATREYWGSAKAIWHNSFSSGSRYTQTWYNPNNWTLRGHPDRPPIAGLVHEIGHVLDYKRGTWTDLQRRHEAPVMEQRAIWWENQIRPHYNTRLRDINDW